MKPNIWNLTVFAVLALAVFSYGIVFEEGKIAPAIWNIPFIFWSSFLITVLVVLCTFLGSLYFKREEIKKL